MTQWKETTVRTLLAIELALKWHLKHLNLNIIFLHGDLHEEVYMVLPPGLTPSSLNQACKLEKSIYSLKQTSHNGMLNLYPLLYLVAMSNPPQIIFYSQKRYFTHCSLLVYMDDIILSGNDLGEINNIKEHLDLALKIKDLGPLKFFLSLEIARCSKGIHLW